MILDPALLNLVPLLLLLFLLIVHPRLLLQLGKLKHKFLVVFESRELVFVFVYVTLHIVDFVLKVLRLLVESLAVLGCFLGLPLGLRRLNLVLLDELHQLVLVAL